MSPAPEGETNDEQSARADEYSDTVVRSRAAAFRVAEILTMVANALTKRSARQVRRGRARGTEEIA